MTHRRLAPACIVATMAATSPCWAGVWSTTPMVGVDTEHSTNPAVLDTYHTAETHAALLLDSPLLYNSDGFQFSFLPHLRISDSTGYSTLASNYVHADIAGEWDTERSTLIATVSAARDSTLYRDYRFNLDGSTGVRRDTTLADLNWTKSLTERVNFATEINSTRVLYGNSASIATLTDYRYTSIAPILTRALSERIKLTMSGSLGRYQSLDGTTKSDNANLQLGFIQQWNELWSLTATAGYSRASNHYDAPFVHFESNQNGSVFKAILTRQASLVSFSAMASRALAPSGFAFLSRQDAYELKLNYPATARWLLTGDVGRFKTQDSTFLGAIDTRSFVDLSLSATWQWTEFCTVSLNASRIDLKYSANTFDVASDGLSIQVSRRFNTTVFH
jgi:hypothetical protein